MWRFIRRPSPSTSRTCKTIYKWKYTRISVQMKRCMLPTKKEKKTFEDLNKMDKVHFKVNFFDTFQRGLT
ncbi:hypothetical protein Hanom_Chr07g00673331 [Helianthus anomalus]